MDDTKKKKKLVSIFGAGIAGMTAAHELAQRGFIVTVYDAKGDERYPCDPARPRIGGLAATQYQRWPANSESLFRRPGNEPFVQAPSLDLFPGWKKYVDRWPVFEDFDASRSFFAKALANLIKKSPTGFEEVWLLGTDIRDAPTNIDTLADAILDTLNSEGARWRRENKRHPNAKNDEVGRRYIRFDLPESPNYRSLTLAAAGRVLELANDNKWLLFVRDNLLPGEHGYRFFPAFYQNLFDILRRIPLLDPAPGDPNLEAIRATLELADAERPREFVASGSTVYDRITGLSRQAVATNDGRPPLDLPRFNDGSLSTAAALFDTASERLGLSTFDMVRMQLRILRYATSSSKRRAEYEHMTWAEFCGAEECSEEFRIALQHFPRALVGLSADRADARSFGSVQLQLLADLARPEGFRDGSLDAPTTEAWFDHWRKYLNENYNVTFRVASIDTIVESDDKKRLLAQFKDKSRVPSDQYVVLALDLPQALELVGRMDSDAKSQGVFSALEELKNRTKDENIRSLTGSSTPFAHFGGIQFFLEEDHHVLRGHIYYADSKWALTSISPYSYRRDQPGYRERANGMVSVIIGDWSTSDGEFSASQCEPKELARRVWLQIRESLVAARVPPPDTPLAFHVDRALSLTGGTGATNETPFLVNDVALADWWPEEPGNYRVDRGIVWAGTWLRTYTRLVTMEAACESGRHAANAILNDYRKAQGPDANYAPVHIHDLEDLEPADLQYLKRLDAELVDRGLPHFFDVLGIDKAAENLIRDSRGGVTIIDLISELTRDSSSVGAQLSEALRRGLRSLNTMFRTSLHTKR